MTCSIKVVNRYDIIMASDVAHEIFDIYIDTIDAWTAKDAITEFCNKHFAFEKYRVYGGRLFTETYLFQAFPTRLDTDHPSSYIFLLEDAKPLKTLQNFTNFERRKRND